jgi:hypothetical protein
MLSPFATPWEQQMRVPLCARHANHWRWRSVLHGAGLGVLLAAALCFPFVRVLPWWVWPALGGCFLAWLAACLAARLTMTRVVRITGTTLVLTRVAPAFVTRLAEGREERRLAPPRAAKRPAPAAEEARPYRVVGVLAGGQRQVVGTFADEEQAQACVRFLQGGGKFVCVLVEGPGGADRGAITGTRSG